MEKEKHICRYRFYKWLLSAAMKNKRIYYLLWGMLFVIAICAYKFGLVGLGL